MSLPKKGVHGGNMVSPMMICRCTGYVNTVEAIRSLAR